MGKSGKLFKAFVSSVKAFKSPSKERAEKDRTSDKVDNHVRKGSKEKCLWSLGKSSSRNRDSLSAAAAFLDAPEIKSVQVENLHVKDVLPTSGSYASDSGNASKGLNSLQDKSLTDRGPLKLMKEFEKEELAAVKIQSAIRRYLAAKRVFQALRALVRLQALIRGRIVRKQAATALRCMQALVRVQALARGRRVRSSELGQLIQKHIQQSKQQKKKPAEGWVSSMGSLQQLQAKAQSKQDAVMKRQRALVYAFSEQLNRCTFKQACSTSLDYEPDKSHWGWVWLERWMAAQPAGIPHNVAKEQHDKEEPAQEKLDADLDADTSEGDILSVQEPVETNDFKSFTGHEELGIVLDDTANHAVDESPAAEEKEKNYWAVRESVEQMDDEKDNMMFETPTVENANVVKRPLTLPPLPPPPPPPFSMKVVPKPSPPFSVPSPPTVKMAPPPPPLVAAKVARRSLPPSTPPPPPPPPPTVKRTKPLSAHECSSSNLLGTCSQTAGVLSTTTALELLEEQSSSTPDTSVSLPFLAAPASPDLPSLSNVSSTSATSYNEPTEFLPAPSISERYHDPLPNPNQISFTTSSFTSKNGGIIQVQREEATVPILMSNPLPEVLSPHSSSSPILFPDVMASSPQQYVTSRTPLIIPSATEEDMSDTADETRVTASEDDFILEGDREVSLGEVVTMPEQGRYVDSTAGNADQGEIDKDVDTADMANVLNINEPIQVDHLTEVNGRGAASGLPPSEKAMEIISNKHTASPTSRQGQLMEASSPSLPNYMTTTKSSKAKIRSPGQKLDSPKQKSDSPKPRFDASKSKIDPPKQKVDSPKQRRDSSKQKADSPSQKADSAAKRRHSLSALEGKGSPGAYKSATHVRASSKGQLASLKGDTCIEDSPHSNGLPRRLEK